MWFAVLFYGCSDQKLQLTWYGVTTFLLEKGETTILVDPFLINRIKRRRAIAWNGGDDRAAIVEIADHRNVFDRHLVFLDIIFHGCVHHHDRLRH